MNKKHFMAILALSVVLFGSQVQNTYGTDEILEEQGAVPVATEYLAEMESAANTKAVEPVATDVVVVEEAVAEEPVEEPVVEEPVVEEPSVEEPSIEEPPVEEPTVEEPSEEVAGDDQKAEDIGSEEVKNPSKDTEASDRKEESDNQKTDKDEKTETSKPSKTPSKVPSNDKKQPVKVVKDSKNEQLNEKVKNIINESYKPSEDFVSWCDKIKYSVETPIEDLPPFINQEMVVGALKSQDEYGIPASVTIAQIIAESGFGSYGEGGEKGLGLSYLAYGYNNLFGVKGTGTAGSVQMKTGEQDKAGNRYTITAGFRVYYTYTEAIEDRAEILVNYYDDLTEGVQDANTYAMQIAGRWATGITYGRMLINIMEKYDLYRLDKMTLQEYGDLVGSFINPCPGATLTDGFGYRDVPIAGATAYHKGIDLGTGAYNLPTYAVKEGTVTFAAYDSGAGNLIIIDHGDGLVTKYMHHKQIYVKEGDKVVQGQQIGISGTTGISTGNHLHFQVEENGIAVNPASYFKEKE